MSRDYLNRILNLCTDKQKEIFYKMYPEGPTPKQLRWAIQQIERTLLDLNLDVGRLKDIEKEFSSYKEGANLLVKNLEKDLRDSKNLIKELERKVNQLSSPINLENLKIQQRLDKLEALEAAGVDNWEGYGYAMSSINNDN